MFVTVYILAVFFSHYLVAKAYESKGEFRSALQHEKDCYAVYKNQVSDPYYRETV